VEKAVPFPVSLLIGATSANGGSNDGALRFVCLEGAASPRTPARGLDAVARRWRKMLDPYRPELHYMRGPGPKWREKRAHGTAR